MAPRSVLGIPRRRSDVVDDLYRENILDHYKQQLNGTPRLGSHARAASITPTRAS